MPASCLKTTHPLSKKNYCHAVNPSRHTPSNHQHSSTTPRQNQTITRKRYKNSPSRFPPPFPHSPQKATPTKTQQFPPPPPPRSLPHLQYISKKENKPHTPRATIRSWEFPSLSLSLSLGLNHMLSTTTTTRTRTRNKTYPAQPSPAYLLTYFLTFFLPIS